MHNSLPSRMSALPVRSAQQSQGRAHSDSMSQQLVSRNFDQHCQMFQQNRQQVQESQEFIHKTVEQNTTHEMNDVKHAVERLNRKVDAIMKTPQVQQENKKIEVASQQMEITAKKAMEAFALGKKTILARTDLSPQQKSAYTEAMYKKILAKLYSPEEIARFEQMFKNIVIVGSQPGSSGHPALMGSTELQNPSYGTLPSSNY